MRTAGYWAVAGLAAVVLQGCVAPNSFSGRYVEPTSGPTAHFIMANDSRQEVQVSTYRSARNCYYKLGVAREVGTSEAPTTVLIPAGGAASFTMYVRNRGEAWRSATFTIAEIVPNERYALHVVDSRERNDRVGWRVLRGHPSDSAAESVAVTVRAGQGSPTREGLWCR